MKNTNKKRDQKMFRRTAVRAKKININPRIMRGGIRL
ncbi:DNA binding protein [Microvirus mar28]|uniref:DNA binding protein n=1 Tax=Microvirus mar28 TaxID=2851161 RepID=A0A8F5MK77_9VIRU|nr:DNA binding protein [Microvirus mar28]